MCVETQPAGSSAAISVSWFVALATSRYASRGPLVAAVAQPLPARPRSRIDQRLDREIRRGTARSASLRRPAVPLPDAETYPDPRWRSVRGRIGPPTPFAAERRKRSPRPVRRWRGRPAARSHGIVKRVAREPFEQRRRQPDGEPRNRGRRFVADRTRASTGSSDAEPARDAGRRPAGGRRQQQKPDAAVNREDAAMIVEADQRVDVAARSAETAAGRALPLSVASPDGSTSPTRPPARVRRCRARGTAGSSWHGRPTAPRRRRRRA